MNIQSLPVWKTISPYKKPWHLLKIALTKRITKLYPNATFIGITGSVGKTTTKEACLAVLSEQFPVVASHANLDPIFNIPKTVLKIRPNTKKVILEFGIEYHGEMDFYLSMVKPAIGVVTRIYYAHSQFLGSAEEIAREKGKLIASLPKKGFAVLNYDDIYTRQMAKLTEAEVVYYGTDKENCHIWASNVRLENGKTKFELNCGVERVEVTIKLLGHHFVYPALAAAAVGVCQGMNLIKIKKGLEKMAVVPHRMQLKEGLGSYDVIDDTYNSSPAAAFEALNVLNELPARRRIVVLGEMRELGSYSEKLHREVAQKLYKDKVDIVLLGVGDTRFIADELIKLGMSGDRIEINLSNSQIVNKILSYAKKGDIILVKGSRAVKLDEVVQRITKPEPKSNK